MVLIVDRQFYYHFFGSSSENDLSLPNKNNILILIFNCTLFATGITLVIKKESNHSPNEQDPLKV